MSITTEVDLPTLTKEQARALTDRIKAGIEQVYEDLLAAFALEAWVPLGYANADEWAVAELNDLKGLRVNRDQRREINKAAAGANLSTRRMAEILGVDQKTVQRDMVAGEANASPRSTIGTDGKTYTRPALAVVPEPEEDEDVVDAEIIEEDEVPQGPHPTDGMTARQRNKTEHHGLEWRVNVLQSFDQQVGELNDLSDGTVTADDLRDWLKIVTAHQGGAARFKKYLTTQLKNLEDTTP